MGKKPATKKPSATDDDDFDAALSEFKKEVGLPDAPEPEPTPATTAASPPPPPAQADDDGDDDEVSLSLGHIRSRRQ